MTEDLRITTAAGEDATTVLIVAGDLDLHTVDALTEEALAAIDAGSLHLIIDFSELTFCDSSGLNALVRLHRRLQPDGSLVLASVPDRLMRMLFITGLNNVFTIVRDPTTQT